jgi:hypothetical protein
MGGIEDCRSIIGGRAVWGSGIDVWFGGGLELVGTCTENPPLRVGEGDRLPTALPPHCEPDVEWGMLICLSG